MVKVNTYSKQGVLQNNQLETDNFDIYKPVSGTSVPGLHVAGQSKDEDGPAVWYPLYIAGTDVPVA